MAMMLFAQVICARSNAQRQDLKKAYKTSFGRDLIADLKVRHGVGGGGELCVV